MRPGDKVQRNRGSQEADLWINGGFFIFVAMAGGEWAGMTKNPRPARAGRVQRLRDQWH
jgi:hypothetical protein